MLSQRFSLKAYITTIFISLIILIAGSLAWFNYLKISDLLINISDKLFNQVATEIIQDVHIARLPVTNSLDVMSKTTLFLF